jgi:plasmid stabilization system protein ParE
LAFTVELTNSALRDAREHLKYLNSRSNFEDIGGRWWSRLLEVLETLQEMPQRCTIYPHTVEGHRDLRYMLFGAHRIIFRMDIEKSRVIVLRVFHTARSAQ